MSERRAGAAGRPHRDIARRRHRIKVLGGGLIALLLVLNAASLYTARYAGRVYPGVRVAGVELGGLDREAARARLEADAAATGRHIDTATAAERALAVGRGGGLLPDAAAWLGALALGRDLAPPPAVVGGEPTPSPLAVGGEPAPPVEAPPVPSPEPVYPATVGGGRPSATSASAQATRRGSSD